MFACAGGCAIAVALDGMKCFECARAAAALWAETRKVAREAPPSTRRLRKTKR